MADVTRDPEAWARLGVKIRERRESMGLSRRQLGERAGVSEKSIQVAEEGRTPRARWPQSLRLIEAALGWQPGSMLQILQGADPESLQDLFSLAEEESAAGEQAQLFPASVTEEALPIKIQMRPTNNARSMALASFPRSFRESLSEVLNFGRKARSFGADTDLVDDYERAAEQLLLDLLKRGPLGRQAADDSGPLEPWVAALGMGPALRREREERERGGGSERRRLLDYQASRARRAPAGDAITSGDVIRELRSLAAEVARLSEKVDGVTNEADEKKAGPDTAPPPEGS